MSSSGQLVRLETVGRKTGDPHTVLLRYAIIGPNLIVFPEVRSRQDWVLNILTNPQVRVHAEGRVMEGTASIGRIAGKGDPILAVFSRKYGDKVVRDTYWGQTEYVKIHLGIQVSTEDLTDLAYADLEAAFDGVAEQYDHHIFGNPINVWLRNRSISLMLSTFRPGDTVLEVGCGTGTETLSLAKAGLKVIATDLSSKMLGVLDSKAAGAGLQDRIITIHCRPYELGAKLRERGIPGVDGAYSTYGAVNTDPRLHDFARNLSSLLADGGRLVLGVWNRFCLYEMVGYFLKANPSMSVARLRNPVPVGKSRFCVATNSYTVGDLSAILGDRFRLERVWGVGIFLPPSNLTKYMPPGKMSRIVEKTDVALEGRFPWNRLGDHFLAVYSKT